MNLKKKGFFNELLKLKDPYYYIKNTARSESEGYL